MNKDVEKVKKLEFEVEPLFDEDKEKVCICCPEAHIYSYKYSKDITMEIYDFVRNMIREDKPYEKKKFKVIIEEV